MQKLKLWDRRRGDRGKKEGQKKKRSRKSVNFLIKISVFRRRSKWNFEENSLKKCIGRREKNGREDQKGERVVRRLLARDWCKAMHVFEGPRCSEVRLLEVIAFLATHTAFIGPFDGHTDTQFVTSFYKLRQPEIYILIIWLIFVIKFKVAMMHSSKIIFKWIFFFPAVVMFFKKQKQYVDYLLSRLPWIFMRSKNSNFMK